MQRFTRPLILLTSLFFMWGFLTSMNDILIPFLKNAFQLSQAQSMLVQLAFFTSYFVGSLIYFIISITYGDPINKIGYKNGIIAGLLISAAGAAMFYPAANAVSYNFFLVALFVMGGGFSLLQISANPYVAILGEENSASSRLNLAQGFNSIGTTIAPLIGSFLIFHYFASSGITAEALKEGASDPDAVKIPYLIFAGVLISIAVLIALAKLPRFTNTEKVPTDSSILRYPYVIAGMFAIFFYVGGEVSIGSNLIAFLKSPDIAGLTEDQGSIYVSLYWGGMMIGRFLGAIAVSNIKNQNEKMMWMAISMILTMGIIFGAIAIKTGTFDWQGQAIPYAVFSIISLIVFRMAKFKPAKTLLFFAIIIIEMLIVTSFVKGEWAIWHVMAIGLFNSIMWSNIFTLAIEGLGPLKSQASALLVMMVIGGGIYPMLQGWVVDVVDVRISFLIPAVAYAYLAWYAAVGYRLGKKPETV